MGIRRGADYVPPVAEQTAAFQLFHNFYMVKMKSADRLRDSDHSIFGVVMPNDRDLQRQLAKAEDFQYLTVADMAHVAINEGKYIALHDPRDSVPIYRMIDKHLVNWRDALKYSDPEFVPLEGLYEFDQLASMMINVARGNGLISLIDRREVYRTSRVLRAGRHAARINPSKLVHTSSVFNDILITAKNRGHDVWRFRREAAALSTETTERGSMTATRERR